MTRKHSGKTKPHQNFMNEPIFFYEKGVVCGKKIINLSNKLQSFISFMDGRTSDDILREIARKELGFKLSRSVFERLVRKLEYAKLLAGRNNGCLLSKLSFSYLEKVKDARTVRRPLYAGYCYPDNPEELRKKLRWCFSFINHERLSFFYKNIKELKGMLVPHSNIELSGQCAAWAYKMLEKWPLPDLVIIFAPDHSLEVKVPYTVLLKDFYTPLGPVKVDKDIGRELANKCGFDIFAYNAAHIIEHAIEIQLPFLQYVYKTQMSKIRILPVLCGAKKRMDPANFALWQGQFTKAIRELIKSGKKRILLIASGDLKHTDNISAYTMFHKKNQRLVGLLKSGDAEDFRANSRFRTCCRWPAYTLLKTLNIGKGTVLNYSWSLNPNFINKNGPGSPYANLTNIGFASIIY